jgi:ribosomal protein L4
LANQRQGTKKTKTKGEVAGGGAKPWRQKGTGRARSGSIRNPQFRGGGVVFGPTGKENYSLDINKKLKKNVLQSLLGEKMRSEQLIIIDKLELDNYRTKEAEKLLTNLLTNNEEYKDLESQIKKLKEEIQVLKTTLNKTIEQQKELVEKEQELAGLKKKMEQKQKTKTLIILAHQEEKKTELIRSFRNLSYVNLAESKLLNMAQILPFNSLIFTQLAFSEIEKRLS